MFKRFLSYTREIEMSCSELELASISSPSFALLQEVSRGIHHFRMARARLTPRNGARTSVRDIVRGLFADVKR